MRSKKTFRVKYVEGSVMNAITTIFAARRRPEVKNTSHPVRYVFIAKRSYAVASSNARLSLSPPPPRLFGGPDVLYNLYPFHKGSNVFFSVPVGQCPGIRHICFFVPSVSRRCQYCFYAELNRTRSSLLHSIDDNTRGHSTISDIFKRTQGYFKQNPIRFLPFIAYDIEHVK